MTGDGVTVGIVGEAWEAPFAAATLRDLRRCGPVRVVVPPELSGLAGVGSVTCAGTPSGRFRGYDEIADDIGTRLAHQPHRLVPAGVVGDDPLPVHRPHTPRHHQRERVGRVDVWTADTCDDYFAAILAVDGAGPPVWTVYGPGRPVFVYNTNDFAEPAPRPHDDYVILGSGLLGLRMVTESGPAAGARVHVYDINPNQLAWSRFVVTGATRYDTLDALVRAFRGHRPAAAVRNPMPHEADNAALQARWYAENRSALAALADRVEFRWMVADLLNRPGDVLSGLRPRRRAFFMYLDLFVVWHTGSATPWIVQFPDLARSLEREVRRRTADATFLPGPASRTLQLNGSPLLGAAGGG